MLGLSPEKYLNVCERRPPAFTRRIRPLTDAERQLDRDMHAAFVGVFGPNGTVPSPGIQDIRQGKQHPWRVLARRLVEMQRAHVEKEVALRIHRELGDWIDELWDTPRTA